MKLTEAQMRRVEAALTFDPGAERRGLLDRTAVAVADAPTLCRRIAQVLGEGADAAQLAVDRLLTGIDQLNVNYLERGMIAADAVARVEVRNGESQLVGGATGFLISPRLLLTNHRALPTADDAAQSWVHFRNEFDAFGNAVESSVFALDPSEFFLTDADLDVSVVAVAPETPDRRQRLTQFGFLRLPASADTVLPGEWLSVVHHPGGHPKQISLRQNLLIKRDDAELWYATETATASSGAPMFNDSWQVVAVHRGGAPARDRDGHVLTVDGGPWLDGADETRVVWRAGVGTRVCAIVRLLAEARGEHPLIADVLSAIDVDAADAIAVPPHGEAADVASSGNGTGVHDSDDAPHWTPDGTPSLTVTVPLRITVRAGDGAEGEPAVGVNVS